MRALVQRVLNASVEVDGTVVGRIGAGLLVFLGVTTDDTEDTARALAAKVASLRIFSDENGKMNRSILDVNGSFLVISQFTLYGDCTKGTRPSFDRAAPPEKAEHIYNLFVQLMRDKQIPVATGTFRAHMKVSLVNDGPVTLMCEISK